MQAGTSEFALGTLSSTDIEEQIEEEPAYRREPLAQISSQMTVPETPSPDVLDYKHASLLTLLKACDLSHYC